MGQISMPPEVDECQAHRDRAERLSLRDAYLEGMRVGALGLSCSLNPWQAETAHHKEWAHGWRNAVCARAAGVR